MFHSRWPFEELFDGRDDCSCCVLASRSAEQNRLCGLVLMRTAKLKVTNA